MAQLVERLVRNEEASGSNPLSSTKKIKTGLVPVFIFFWIELIVRNAELSAVQRGRLFRVALFTRFSV